MSLAELGHAHVLRASFKLSRQQTSTPVHKNRLPASHLLALSLSSGPSMETSSISSPMLPSLLDRMER